MNLFIALRKKIRSAVFLFLICISFPLISQESILKWEKDIRQFEILDSLYPDPEGAILFAGSSSIRLWDSLASDMQPYSVIQRGYGGARLTDFLYYSERILYPHQPRAIVIFIANDITGGIGDVLPDEVAKMFKELVDKIRLKMPETPVFWIAITPTASRWKSWPVIQQANQAIEEYCQETPNVFFIPTAQAFLNDQGEPRNELFREDQLHLNRDGYKVWTLVIREQLQKILGEPATNPAK